MSNQEFENYIALIGKLLQLSSEQREKISGELQDHLQMRIADLMSEGVSQHDATTQALEEFGDAAVMAKNFQSVINLKRRRWMMRFATFSIAAMFLATVLTMALWPDNARFGSPDSSMAQVANQDKDSDSKSGPSLSLGTQLTMLAEAALKKPIDLQFEETPWSEIQEELESKTRLNFLLSSSARDDALTEDDPITINLVDIPAAKAINMMLEQKNATFVIDDGVIVIISLDDSEDARWFRRKMFNCQELVKRLPKTAPAAMPAGMYGGFSGGGGGFGGGGLGGGQGGGGVFAIQAAAPNQEQIRNTQESQPNESKLLDQKLERLLAMARAEAEKNKTEPTAEYTLLQLVQNMIAPDSWEITGQGLGNVDLVNGILIVYQREEVLQEIDSFLADLEGNILSDGKVGISAAMLKSRQSSATKAVSDTATAQVGSTGNSPFGSDAGKEGVSDMKMKSEDGGSPFAK